MWWSGGVVWFRVYGEARGQRRSQVVVEEGVGDFGGRDWREERMEKRIEGSV